MTNLHSLFYSNLDSSYFVHLFDKLKSGQQLNKCVFLGEGMHFKVWKVVVGPNNFSFVLKIPNERFLHRKTAGELLQWKQGLKRLTQKSLDFILPCEVVDAMDSFFVVMPYGKPVFVNKDYSEECMRYLKDCGFFIDDHLQFVTIDGLNYLCDYSDLVTFNATVG